MNEQAQETQQLQRKERAYMAQGGSRFQMVTGQVGLSRDNTQKPIPPTSGLALPRLPTNKITSMFKRLNTQLYLHSPLALSQAFPLLVIGTPAPLVPQAPTPPLLSGFSSLHLGALLSA